MATRGFAPLGWLYRASYRLGLAVARRRLLSHPETLRLQTRRGLLQPDWSPGSSDIDLYCVIRKQPPETELPFLRRFWNDYEALQRRLPFLGELQVVDEEQERDVAALQLVRASDYSAPPRPPSDPWLERWKHLSEALNACLFLLQQAWFSREPARGLNIAKGCLDTIRHCRVPAGKAPKSRSETLESIEDRALRAVLESGLDVDDDRACKAVAETILLLDRACDAFVRDAVEQGLTSAPGLALPEPWAGSLPNSEHRRWRAWAKRFEAPHLPPARGVYYDGATRWYLLADLHEAGTLENLLREARDVHREDQAFQTPPIVASAAIFQLLLWTSHLDNPFLYLALSPELNPLGLSARYRSRLRLASWERRAQQVQWRISASDFIAPPRRLLGYSIKQAAADLTLSLRLFALGDWAGDNAYRLCYLYGRLLALRLHLGGEASVHPDDIDRLLELSGHHDATSAMAAGLRESLSRDPEVVNRLPPFDWFAAHYPDLRRLSDEINRLLLQRPQAEPDNRDAEGPRERVTPPACGNPQ